MFDLPFPCAVLPVDPVVVGHYAVTDGSNAFSAPAITQQIRLALNDVALDGPGGTPPPPTR